MSLPELFNENRWQWDLKGNIGLAENFCLSGNTGRVEVIAAFVTDSIYFGAEKNGTPRRHQ